MPAYLNAVEEKNRQLGSGMPSKKTSFGMRSPFLRRMKFPAWTSCMVAVLGFQYFGLNPSARWRSSREVPSEQ